MQRTATIRSIPGKSEALARLWCYMLGPLSAAVILRARRFSANPAIRFHAYYSLLAGTAWILVASLLLAIEHLSPWFFGLLMRETRFMFNMVCAGIWIWLTVAAYRGWPTSVLPWLERKARRWAGVRRPVTHAA